MKKHYETHVEDTDKLISVAGPVLDYKSWYEQYRKLMEEQAQRKYGLYTPTSEGDDDDFPSIPGMIARYSASGLTNEQMAANPVWVDKTGNGYDLQLKNFAWGGMSGVGGYEYNFLSSDWVVGKVQLSEALSYKITIVDKKNTEEELTKIKDYFVKTYPWLFPDQAWTVTGKTNEDADRATIANITGNGNNLVLSNFGFAEGSGYGLYAYNFNSFSLKDNTVKPTDVKKDSFRIIGTGDRGNVLVLSNVSNSADWKIRITGMKDGDHLLAGNANKSGDYVKITKDGVYTFQKQYAANATNGIWYNSSQEVDVLVEQIPEYEGYLVTDGVDDKITSSDFKIGKDFTIVGDWKFIIDENKGCGLVKVPKLYIYNSKTGLDIYINSNSIKNILSGIKGLNAVCSDGRVYDCNWNEISVKYGNMVDINSSFLIANSGNIFTKMAFKNLGIYNNQLLSKDDCIKAYNYLQTLKSK